MKYLVIVALVVLLLLLVYSRVHPYLKVLKKVLGTVRAVTSAQPGTGSSAQRATAESKLVRCVGCGTWVPADRAIGSKASLTYCSRDCLEKPAEKKESKLAG